MSFVAFNFILPDGNPMTYFIESDVWDGTLETMHKMQNLEEFCATFAINHCDDYTKAVVKNYEEGLRHSILPQVYDRQAFLTGYFLATVLLPHANEELWNRTFTTLGMPDMFDRQQVYDTYMVAASLLYNEVALEHRRAEPWTRH